MAFCRATKTVLVVLAVCAILDVPLAEGFFKECWETWSRCTNWSSLGTGVLWQGCNTRCKCLGREGGTCVRTKSQCPLTEKAWQCQCYGSYNNPKPGRWCGF